MNQYNGLLVEAARKYNIYKGERESETDWKVRLIYSICGMMAYASLWDNIDDEPVSIVHVKKRIRRILASYKTMYPELDACFTNDSAELEDEITGIFLNAGVVYHNPYRIAPSMKREASAGKVLFQRGIALDSISYVSGIGFYSEQTEESGSDEVKAMFGLQGETLQTLWNNTLSAASWEKDAAFEGNTEYLRLEPPFTYGYWVNNPETDGRVSILRSGPKGLQVYYLYRASGSAMEVSPLPQWQTVSFNYSSLANACLAAYGKLPPIEYAADGDLIHVRMPYLLPPRELNFLKLYSWPEICIPLPCDFKRKLSVEVFDAIKNVLTDEGYEFRKGKL